MWVNSRINPKGNLKRIFFSWREGFVQECFPHSCYLLKSRINIVRTDWQLISPLWAHDVDSPMEVEVGFVCLYKERLGAQRGWRAFFNTPGSVLFVTKYTNKGATLIIPLQWDSCNKFFAKSGLGIFSVTFFAKAGIGIFPVPWFAELWYLESLILKGIDRAQQNAQIWWNDQTRDTYEKQPVANTH